MSERSRSRLGMARRLALTSSLALVVWAATFALAVSLLSSGAPVAMARPPKGTTDADGIQISWDAKTRTVTVNWQAQSGTGVSKVTVFIVVYRNSIAQSWTQYDYEYKAPYLKTQSGVSIWSDAPARSGDTIWSRLLVYSPKSGMPVSDTNDALIVP